MPHRTEFKLAELIYRCLHSLAPSYLADGFHCVADVNYSRRCLWSVLMAALFVPQSSYHCWWPCVPCGCHANMEQFTARCHVVTIAVHIQASPQDCSVHSKLLLKLRLRTTILSRCDSRHFRIFVQWPRGLDFMPP